MTERESCGVDYGPRERSKGSGYEELRTWQTHVNDHGIGGPYGSYATGKMCSLSFLLVFANSFIGCTVRTYVLLQKYARYGGYSKVVNLIGILVHSIYAYIGASDPHTYVLRNSTYCTIFPRCNTLVVSVNALVRSCSLAR